MKLEQSLEDIMKKMSRDNVKSADKIFSYTNSDGFKNTGYLNTKTNELTVVSFGGKHPKIRTYHVYGNGWTGSKSSSSFTKINVIK